MIASRSLEDWWTHRSGKEPQVSTPNTNIGSRTCPICVSGSGITFLGQCPSCCGTQSVSSTFHDIIIQRGCSENPRYIGSARGLRIVHLSRYARTDMQRFFTEYRLRWSGANSLNDKAYVTQTGSNAYQEFPWIDMPIPGLVEKFLKVSDTFYAYVTNKIPNTEYIHMGYRDIGKNIKISELSRIYKIGITRQITLRGPYGEGKDNYKKHIFQGPAPLLSGWLDRRIFDQIGSSAEGDFFIASNLTEAGNEISEDVNLFGDEGAFYGEYNPLSIAALTRYAPACPEILGLVTVTRQLVSESEAVKPRVQYQHRIDTSKPVVDTPAAADDTIAKSIYSRSDDDDLGYDGYGCCYPGVMSRGSWVAEGPKKTMAVGYFELGKLEEEMSPIDELFKWSSK